MRGRTTFIAAVVVAVVLVVVGFALLAMQRRILTENLDESLATHSESIAREIELREIDSTIRQQGDDDSIAQVVDAEGNVIAATANFVGQPPLPTPAVDGPSYRSARLLPREPSYRLLSRATGTVVIHTASPLDDIDESLAALRIGLALAIPVAVGVLAALMWWLVGRTLRPVEAIRREVSDITDGSLDRRVPEPATGDEVDRLARTMNEMLDRIEHAVERQQRFVADASHELRSPLTRMRSELEVNLAHPAPLDAPALLRSALEEVDHLQRIVEDLLLLARADAPASSPWLAEPVDLDDIVLDEARRLRSWGPLRVDSTGVSAAQVRGDRTALARAVRNLTDNAAHHARSAVIVTLREASGNVTLTVADDGPGIPPDQHEVVFERFARLDGARTRDRGGTGLGLAITRDVVARHGGTVRVDSSYSTGARFVVEMPAATPA